ncbi:MAG: hypothetical protein LKJ86_00115 [Oscillibacter sp.]|jgi:hypothetical protein|nr:hypothetical protein [Oscillibacter sp.]
MVEEKGALDAPRKENHLPEKAGDFFVGTSCPGIARCGAVVIQLFARVLQKTQKNLCCKFERPLRYVPRVPLRYALPGKSR